MSACSCPLYSYGAGLETQCTQLPPSRHCEPRRSNLGRWGTTWGSPEGHRPFGRSLRVSLRTSFYFPLPGRKGARGMVSATIETTRSEAGVTHATPLQIAARAASVIARPPSPSLRAAAKQSGVRAGHLQGGWRGIVRGATRHAPRLRPRAARLPQPVRLAVRLD